MSSAKHLWPATLFLALLLMVSKDVEAQSSDLTSLMAIQVEAKDPGLAALIAVSTPFPGLAHYYAGNARKATAFVFAYVIGVGVAVAAAGPTDDVEARNVQIGVGLGIVFLTKILEPFSAYRTAVAYNRKLLQKHNIELSFGRDGRIFSAAYRF